MTLILQGLLNYLGRCKDAGTLSHLAGADGLVNCVFICCDLPYQYIDEYLDKVSSDEFHPINNHVSTLLVISQVTEVVSESQCRGYISLR